MKLPVSFPIALNHAHLELAEDSGKYLVVDQQNGSRHPYVVPKAGRIELPVGGGEVDRIGKKRLDNSSTQTWNNWNPLRSKRAISLFWGHYSFAFNGVRQKAPRTLCSLPHHSFQKHTRVLPSCQFCKGWDSVWHQENKLRSGLFLLMLRLALLTEALRHRSPNLFSLTLITLTAQTLNRYTCIPNYRFSRSCLFTYCWIIVSDVCLYHTVVCKIYYFPYSFCCMKFVW